MIIIPANLHNKLKILHNTCYNTHNYYGYYNMYNLYFTLKIASGWPQKVLAPVVQTLDSAIHWINHYPAV